MRQSTDQSQWLWQHGQVVASADGCATIQFKTHEQCARCAAGEGCGAGVFSQLFSRTGSLMTLPVSFDPSVGDWVRVGLAPTDLVRGALWLYGLPVVCFVLALTAGASALGVEGKGLPELAVLLLAIILGVISIPIAGHLRSRSMTPTVLAWSCLESEQTTET